MSFTSSPEQALRHVLSTTSAASIIPVLTDYSWLLQRMAPPKGTQEPEIPEAPGYADTPVDPIIIDPSKHLTHAECLE